MVSGKADIKKIFNAWVKTPSFYHVVFWFVCFVVVFLTGVSSMGWRDAFFTDLVNIGFFVIIAYINYFILFPKYLKDKNLLWHFGALFLVALLLTPIKLTCFYIVTSANAELQSSFMGNRFFIFFTTFLVGTSTTIYMIMNDWIVQQREKKDLESRTLQSELKFLKSQINPHFLFNTLNSLYALTLKKSDLAPEIVLKLSEMMRYMLYECNEKEVPLSKEINYMQNYLELEKLRHGSKMLIDFKISGDIDTQKISPLILIPFIENSFKHGINNQVNQGFVNLELNVVEHDLQMVLENSKSPSLPKINEKRSGGIGLVNVKRRMDILYPNLHQLEIKESPNTYKIELNLNLINN